MAKRRNRPMQGTRVVFSTYVRLEDVQELERAGEFEEFWEALGKVERMKARARARALAAHENTNA